MKSRNRIARPFLFLLTVCLFLHAFAVFFFDSFFFFLPSQDSVKKASVEPTAPQLQNVPGQPQEQTPEQPAEVLDQVPARPAPQLERNFPSQVPLPVPLESSLEKPLIVPAIAEPPPVRSKPVGSSVKATASRLQFWGFEDYQEKEAEKPPPPSVLPLIAQKPTLPTALPATLDDSRNTPAIGEETQVQVIEVREKKPGSSFFYNIPIRGQKILFILEASQGMSPNTVGEVLSLENELRRVVDSLKESQKFNIWVFMGNKIARCGTEFMQASMDNKVYSLLWLRSHYQNLAKNDLVEDNKPAGYPESYSSESGLNWVSPLFLGLHSFPDEIFLVSSQWTHKDEQPGSIDAIRFWTREKQVSWKDAYEDTQKWLDDENRARTIKGLPPRAVFNLEALIAKRHPGVQQPPATLKNRDNTFREEMEGLVHSKGLDNRFFLNIILYSPKASGNMEHIHKFSKLARSYSGRFVLVEKNGEIREM